MSHLYPDRALSWSDGSAIPSDLRSVLLARLAPEFDVEHAEFTRTGDGSLQGTLRLSVGQAKDRQIWAVTVTYPADETTAFDVDATPDEREWFALMLRTHIAEWWETRSSNVVVDARRRK